MEFVIAMPEKMRGDGITLDPPIWKNLRLVFVMVMGDMVVGSMYDLTWNKLQQKVF